MPIASWSVRRRLFLVSLALVLAGALSAWAVLEVSLRLWAVSREGEDLTRLARALAQVMEAAPPEPLAPRAAEMARRFAAQAGVRVTLIDAAGRVTLDSSLGEAARAAVESHADRPEVVQAFTEGVGLSRRFSATLGMDLIYAAAIYQSGDERRVARVARSFRAIEDAVSALRVMMLVAGLVGLVVAIGMSGVAASWLTRSFRRVVVKAREVAASQRWEPSQIAARDEVGRVEGSIQRLADELERALSALGEERDRLGAVLSGMSEGVLALDELGRVSLVNPAAREWLDLPEGAKGQPLDALLPVPALLEIAAPLARAGQSAAGTKTRSAEFTLGRPPRRLLATAGARAGARGAVIVLHDVTELRRLETVRQDFVANVSHELRTPISIIRANAETLLEGALDDRQAAERFVQAMVRNADRLSRLIADLLDIARIEAGKFALEATGVDLAPVVARVVEALAPRASGRGTVIDVDLAPDLIATADAKALEQILTNLLDNAVKYTPEASHVHIVGRREGDRVRVEVRDDGPGLPEAQRERVFERFYRIDPGRARDAGGTGLGLSIVKHLIASLHGQVGVGANEPRGTVFWFALPAHVARYELFEQG